MPNKHVHVHHVQTEQAAAFPVTRMSITDASHESGGKHPVPDLEDALGREPELSIIKSTSPRLFYILSRQLARVQVGLYPDLGAIVTVVVEEMAVVVVGGWWGGDG